MLNFCYSRRGNVFSTSETCIKYLLRVLTALLFFFVFYTSILRGELLIFETNVRNARVNYIRST